jgi:hypothetical protein
MTRRSIFDRLLERVEEEEDASIEGVAPTSSAPAPLPSAAASFPTRRAKRTKGVVPFASRNALPRPFNYDRAVAWIHKSKPTPSEKLALLTDLDRLASGGMLDEGGRQELQMLLQDRAERVVLLTARRDAKRAAAMTLPRAPKASRRADGVTGKTYVCNKCDKAFSDLGLYRLHLIRGHRNGE